MSRFLPSDYSKRARLAAFVIVVICAITIANRQIAFERYSPLVTGFSGPTTFRELYLADHLAFYPIGESVRAYSFWSAGIRSGLGDYLQEILYALILKISQLTAIQSSLIHQIVLTPVLILLAVRLLIRRSRGKTSVLDIAVISLFVTIGTPVINFYLTGFDSAWCWILFLSLTLVFVSDIPPVKRSLLTMIIVGISAPLYHTGSLYLVFYASCFWLLSRFVNRDTPCVSPLPLLVYCLMYQMYVSIVFFSAVGSALRDIFAFQFLGRDQSPIVVASVQAGGVSLRYLNAILYALILVLISVVALQFVRLAYSSIQTPSMTALQHKAVPDRRYVVAAAAASVATLCFTLLVGTEFGLGEIANRGAEYAGLAAMVSLIAELRRRGRRRAYLYPLMAVIFALSLYVFHVLSVTAYGGGYFSWQEAAGYRWLHTHLRQNDVVFTDFRLAGQFIADGHLRVVGVTGFERNASYLLDRIYYQESPAGITSAIDMEKTSDGRVPDYLFLSTQMFKPYPGVWGYNNHFPPPKSSLLRTIETSHDWTLIYRNTQVYIFHRLLGARSS